MGNDMLDDFIREINVNHQEIDTFHYCLKIFLLKLAKTGDINSKIERESLYEIANEKVFKKINSNTANVFPKLVEEGILLGERINNSKYFKSFQLNIELQNKLKGKFLLWEVLQVEAIEINYGIFAFELTKIEKKHYTKTMQSNKRDHSTFSNSNNIDSTYEKGESETNSKKIKQSTEVQPQQISMSEELIKLRRDIEQSNAVDTCIITVDNMKNSNFNNYNELGGDEITILKTIILYNLVREQNNGNGLTMSMLEHFFEKPSDKPILEKSLEKLQQSNFVEYNKASGKVILNRNLASMSQFFLPCKEHSDKVQQSEKKVDETNNESAAINNSNCKLFI